MNKQEAIGVIIVGYGYWSPNLIRNIQKFSEFTIIGICEKNLERHDKIRKDYPNFKIFQHYRDAFVEPGVGAVVIGTVISSHYRIAKMALEHGKHVLIEKPMTVTVAEAKTLLKTAQNHSAKIMIDHTYVYSPAIQKLREIIRSGQLGDIHLIDSIRVNLGLFQRDANVVLDLAPHDFSILEYLIEEHPQFISAVASHPIVHPQQDKAQESIAYMSLTFKSGLIAHINVSWLAPVKNRTLTIVGSKKMAVYNQLDPEGKLKIFNKGIILNQEPNQQKPLFDYYSDNGSVQNIDESKEDLEHMIKAFLNYIVINKEPPTSGKFGLNVVSLLAAAQKSILKKGKKVKIKNY